MLFPWPVDGKILDFYFVLKQAEKQMGKEKAFGYSTGISTCES